jgi:Rad3-related DNA helicase
MTGTKEMPVPRTSRYSLPVAGELPETLKRSSRESQEAFTRALASAVQAHGGGDLAVRAAYAEFKQVFEKCGDHWIPKHAFSSEG